jgi:AraC family transcriptional regulator
VRGDDTIAISARPRLLAEGQYVVGHVLRASVGGRDRLGVHRTRVPRADPDLALTWGGARAHVARLNLVALPANAIRQGRRLIHLPARGAMETAFRNVHEPCVWPMAHAIDQITFALPASAVAEWAEDHTMPDTLLPDSISGSSLADPVLKAFGLAALAAIDDMHAPSQFFVDHVLDGVCRHLLTTFGAPRRGLRGGLAPWQERRAKDMMDAATDLSLADLAAGCGLSVAHFSRAFRQSCGMTPHRWMQGRRIDRAWGLVVGSDLTLAAIAQECGFADQAHLTNVFSRHFGSPPGAMRRRWRTAPSGY